LPPDSSRAAGYSNFPRLGIFGSLRSHKQRYWPSVRPDRELFWARKQAIKIGSAHFQDGMGGGFVNKGSVSGQPEGRIMLLCLKFRSRFASHAARGGRSAASPVGSEFVKLLDTDEHIGAGRTSLGD